ncbi:MAG: hypothetical protein HY688_04065 [Chloroflexi bacterium]|nr:hypothetical protein [Chloroflexota bacterium]
MASGNRAHVTALLLGQDAFRDERGRAHVIGIFDAVGATQFPMGFQFSVYCRLHGEGAHALAFRVLDALGRQLVRSEPVTAHLQPDQGHQFFMSLGLQVEAPGLFHVQALVDGELAMAVPLLVDQGPDEWHRHAEGAPLEFQTG